MIEAQAADPRGAARARSLARARRVQERECRLACLQAHNTRQLTGGGDERDADALAGVFCQRARRSKSVALGARENGEQRKFLTTHRMFELLDSAGTNFHSGPNVTPLLPVRDAVP